MKLLEFGSCWGGAMIGSAVEPAGVEWQTEEQGGYCHTTDGQSKTRKLSKVKPSGGTTTHWKPKLNAISENSPLSEVNQPKTGFDDKKRLVKAKPKSTAAPPNHGEEYWKSSHAMSLPAFSPTSFLF